MIGATCRGKVSLRLLVFLPLLLIIPAILFFLAFFNPLISGNVTVNNPRFEHDSPWPGDSLLPSIVRYISKSSSYTGTICFGLVITAKDGLPYQVLNLTAIRPQLGSNFTSFLENNGFRLAEEMFEAATREAHSDFIEDIDPKTLNTVIMPPVDISMHQLEDGKRFIVGVGFNYSTHRKETGLDVEKFLFPKFVEPAGAYQPVIIDGQPGIQNWPSVLIDYEAEIGFVLLEDIDLTSPPKDHRIFGEQIALFIVNDVSDRWPQIIEGQMGYTRAKSVPTFLPIGPWMVHGKYMLPKTRSGGEEALRIRLRVEEAEPFHGGSWRQVASSDDMIRGPFEIIRMASEIYQKSSQADAKGVIRHIASISNGNAVIPAGSIFLTGTPEGTAIEAPTTLDRIRLAVRASLSRQKARLLFARHCAAFRKEMGFLHVDDIVETRVQHLGRQRWEVRRNEPATNP